MAHASVASLMRTIESLLTSNSPMRSRTCDHREEICDLHEKISSMEVFVKNFEKNYVSREMKDFEVEVKEVASAAEHIIQLRLTEVVLANDEKAQERLYDSLQLAAEDIDPIWKDNMVGRDDQQECLLEDLTGSYSGEPEVIPIVGMGGIGKTTLAKEVYYHESILRRFDVCAWATVSQQHNIKEILLSLLQSTIKVDDTVKMKGEAELEDMLQKSLKRKRESFFADGLMDQDESWNLFKRVAFSSEELSSDLETIGKQIAEKCHGLPLTIVVVAGLLKSKREIEDWESIAKDVKSFVTNDPDDRCSQDREIPVKNLMRAWMDEGFLKLEGVDEKCLEELVDRCLVLVCKKSLDGTNIRSFLEFRNMEIDNSPVQILSLIWLRYLALLFRKKVDIPPEICRLWNLQTFIVKVYDRSFVTCPVQIWGLVQLRHLKLPRLYLLDCPSGSVDKGRHLDFSNLQTISYLSPHCCMKKWYPNVRGFTRLKLLLMEDNLLKYWKATDDNFPVLERLVLNECHNLKEIPIEFGEIHTLQLIELTRCLPELGESAARIQKEQEDLGNKPVDWLDHIIMMMMMMKKNKKKKKIQMLILQDDDDDDDSDVDVAKDDDDDDSDVDVAEDVDNEDSDADAAKHDDNYDLNWLFDVQNNL
ncbi:hypothetical protein BC332_24559 [Capsicum chinense]|nr:hypothetical protein BC332_24559 [Capsicum chinense]